MIRAAVLALVVAGLLSACGAEVAGPPSTESEWRDYCVAADAALGAMDYNQRRTLVGMRMAQRVTTCAADGYL